MCVPANRLGLASLLQGPCQESKPTPALFPPPGPAAEPAETGAFQRARVPEAGGAKAGWAL